MGICHIKVSEEMTIRHLLLLGGILVPILGAITGNGIAVLPGVIESLILNLTGTQVIFYILMQASHMYVRLTSKNV